jgi:hypothetical protein
MRKRSDLRAGLVRCRLESASLLLLRENPGETIEAYDGIVKVILRGRVLDRKELSADRGGRAVDQ